MSLPLLWHQMIIPSIYKIEKYTIVAIVAGALKISVVSGMNCQKNHFVDLTVNTEKPADNTHSHTTCNANVESLYTEKISDK